MTLFNFPWLRNFIRKRTSPIPHVKASTWKSRLSIAYALLAWNAFGAVLYAVYNGKADWAKYHGLVSEEEAHLRPGRKKRKHSLLSRLKNKAFIETCFYYSTKIRKNTGRTKRERLSGVRIEHQSLRNQTKRSARKIGTQRRGAWQKNCSHGPVTALGLFLFTRNLSISTSRADLNKIINVLVL